MHIVTEIRLDSLTIVVIQTASSSNGLLVKRTNFAFLHKKIFQLTNNSLTTMILTVGQKIWSVSAEASTALQSRRGGCF